ncbi:MAG: flagellar hook protein FlgE [Pseudohongiellaceae bacterium]|jgi:flagellar hook protein FlgE
MSFNTALSGLRAASQDLAVTGNNIANASTNGFKRSRVEFGDVYANSLIGGGSTPGSGVLVTDIAQQFDQGNVSFTDNNLDLAINGSGMFILSNGGSTEYSRAGSFGLDKDGFLVANNSARLQGFGVNSSGGVDSIAGDLQIQTQNISPQATVEAELEFNLDSRDGLPVVGVFDHTDPDSYNSSTSLTVYDSLGNPHVQTNYFAKTAANTWDMYVKVDEESVIAPVGAPPTGGTAINTPIAVTFNTNGTLAAPLTAQAIDTWAPKDSTGVANGAVGSSGAPATSYTVSIGSSTQYGSEFSVSSIGQDGFAPGRLTGVEVDDSGIIFARYTNGEAQVLGQLALATFSNQQGLTPLGNTSWGESFESGQPAIGAPQTGSLGAVESGALEDSNVDLSEELVRLIIAQRNYQANAKTIETADTVTQAIINLR